MAVKKKKPVTTAATPSYSVKKSFREALVGTMQERVDQVEWVEKNLGLELYSNQIQNFEHLFDTGIDAFNMLCVRGGGKSFGISAGVLTYSILYPGLRTIVVGPKEKQAGRLLKEIYGIVKSKKCLVADQIDREASSAYRIQFKNGSYIVALSGQEGANVEGEHGHILIIDEAHRVPTYSVTNKFIPMVGMLEFQKIVKIGVAIGRNHFHKSCTAPGAIVDKCPWQEAEIFLAKESKKKAPLFYKGKQFSRVLVGRMPIPFKKKYFPDRPDMQQESGQEISTLDWTTQYELEWADDINNFLSDDDQKLLTSGKHNVLVKGAAGELYAAGLDTAQGSITGHSDTDETTLAIWRLRAGLKEKVASYVWKGEPLAQMEEIWQIIHPDHGLFRCKMTLVDYSNIGITITDLFKANKVPIIGRHFGATEPRSKKNWKNAMFDYFLVQLQTEKVKYPSIEDLEKAKIDAKGDVLTQIKNMLRGVWELFSLQRIRGKGLNDKIQAPEENIEESEEGGSMGRAFDDMSCSDCMAVYALGHIADLEQELASGGDLSTYEIPLGVIGRASSSSFVPMVSGGQAVPQTGRNPLAVAEMATRRNAGGTAALPTTKEGEIRQWMSNILAPRK